MSLRRYIRMVESQGGLNLTELYWFWYHPATRHLEAFWEGTHTEHAFYSDAMGLFTPEQREEMGHPDLEDDEIVRKALLAGWVRGRYGYRVKDASMGFMTWMNPETGAEFAAGDPRDLSLHGKQRNVFLTAKHLTEAGLGVHTLFVDFDANDTEMEAHALRGARLEFFLKSGRMPRDTVQEASRADGAARPSPPAARRRRE